MSEHYDDAMYRELHGGKSRDDAKVLPKSETPIPAKQREYISRLQRRHDWLESRVSVYTGNSPSHDKAELSALKWAIKTLTDQSEGKVTYPVLRKLDPQDPKPTNGQWFEVYTPGVYAYEIESLDTTQSTEEYNNPKN